MEQMNFWKILAVCEEALMEQFLDTGIIVKKDVARLILERKLFPCFFGSALKMEGVDAFIRGMETYMAAPVYPSEFGAKVFKIARDDQGNRLTYMKITGGSLKVKETLTNAGRKGIPDEEIWEEKVDQIRIYSGAKFEMLKEAEAGTVCAVTGLTETYPGEGLGVRGVCHAGSGAGAELSDHPSGGLRCPQDAEKPERAGRGRATASYYVG